MSRRTVELAIGAIAAGGDGVGRSEGLVVFVPRTAPRDLVTADLAPASGRATFARGHLRDVVRASPERVEPPCPHYTRDRCGGCQLQHITYAGQLAAKRRIVVDAFARIARREVDVEPVVPSPEPWRYREKLTLALRRSGDGWIAGLHPYDDPAHVFPLQDCPITDGRVVAAWREVLAAAETFPPVPALRGSIRRTSGGPVFTLLGARRWPEHARFVDATPSLAAVYWEPEAGTPGAGRRIVADRRGVAAPAASFAQVNPSMAEQLRAYVRGLVLEAAPRAAVDAYAGAGRLAEELSAAGVATTAIELDADASAWSAARLTTPSRAVTARVEDALPDVLPADVAILNPPRAGVDARVTATLERTPVPLLVYVSCDPATLARDVARLPSYRVVSARPFDMFPQTAHVETVCVLAPEPR